MSSPTAAGEVGRLAGIPGLRTFSSSRFRTLIALVLLGVGSALVLARLVSFDMADPSVMLDFSAYYNAGARVLNGGSPYLPVQFDPAQAASCYECYLYPPLFAQLISPVTLLSLATAKTVWVLVGYAAAYASTWLATGIGGARPSLERLLWCAVAVLLFEAVASAIWVGNVGTLVALAVTMVAAGGLSSGLGLVFGTALKVAPVVFAPMVLISGSRAWRGVALGSVIVGLSFIAAPEAWLRYPEVLQHVFGDPVDSGVNLSLSQAVSAWGEDAVRIMRLLMLALGGLCVLLTVVIVRRPGGIPAATVLGTIAMLVIPGTLWFHYLAVLLPVAAMAWPGAAPAPRTLLLAGGVSIGLARLVDERFYGTLGAVLILTTAAWILWPRATEAMAVGRELTPMGEGG